MFCNLPLKTKLVVTYLLLSIIPFIFISALLLEFFVDTLEQQAFNQLQSVRNIKKTQVQDFFKQIKAQAEYFVGNIGRDQMSSSNTTVVGHLDVFKTDIKSLAQDPRQRRHVLQKLFVPGSEDQPTDIAANRDFYDFSHEDRHPFQKAFIDKFGYEDLLLVSETGDVVYSVKKEANFGVNLLESPNAGTALARAFQNAMLQSADKSKSKAAAGESLYFSDFEKAGQHIRAYISIPLFSFGVFEGAVIYCISIDQLNRILNERTGLGDTGVKLIWSDRIILCARAVIVLHSSIRLKRFSRAVRIYWKPNR
ncbi:MAG: hypothetical protein GY874_10915 [Desulfobacteraceae bacterium]|nr:hypothetical protein [Desulfobacteraceae bacterium]